MTTAAASPLTTLRIIAADIKIAHSVFALPFAVLAAFMAAADPAIDWTRFGGQLGLVILAMVFARTVAMLANRILDRSIDARNPRTAGRALPSGRLTIGTMTGTLAAGAAGFMLVCVAFGALYGNWWPTLLGLPVLAWISAYALFKRFTALCHLYLGSSLAISPLAAALAIEPTAVLSQASLWLLAGMVLCWVAGFDVIYALQDIEADRTEGLHSIPGRYGMPGGIVISRLLHLAAAVLLIATAWADARFSAVFASAVALVICLLLYEHLTVARWGRSRLVLAFFTLNGLISCALGAAGIVDIMVAST